MSSPFSTIEEFNGVLDGPTEGAIYTFADKPMINNIALLVSVGVFLWFIIKTYATHTESSSIDNSLNRLSSFIVVGLLSLVAADYRTPTRLEMHNEAGNQQRVEMPIASYRRATPLGLLGMMSVGLPALGRRKARQRKYKGSGLPGTQRSSTRRSQ